LPDVWRIAIGFGVVVATTLGGCGRSDTGVHIFARVGTLEYDELQFRVTGASGETLVDPMTNGRYQGPFASGDQDVIVYVRDDLGGTPLHCEASALRAAAVMSQGAGDVTVARGEMKTVEIFLAAPGTPDPPDPPDVTARPNGEACSLGSECVTGQCVDGVCCESDCSSACHSCALADSKGLCRPVAADGADPRGMCGDQGVASCGMTGFCAAGGSCALYPAGTECAPLGCGDDGKSVQPAAACDGAGKCKLPPKMKCMDHMTCSAGACADIPDMPGMPGMP